MNPAFQSMLLLVCVAVCTAATVKRCQCLNPSRGVNPSLIARVEVFTPRSHCRKKQVIATLKNNRQVCLDPDFKITKAILETVRMQSERNSAANPTSRTTTNNHPFV